MLQKNVHSPSLDDPIFEAYGHIQYGTDIHRFDFDLSQAVS